MNPKLKLIFVAIMSVFLLNSCSQCSSSDLPSDEYEAEETADYETEELEESSTNSDESEEIQQTEIINAPEESQKTFTNNIDSTSADGQEQLPQEAAREPQYDDGYFLNEQPPEEGIAQDGSEPSDREYGSRYPASVEQQYDNSQGEENNYGESDENTYDPPEDSSYE